VKQDRELSPDHEEGRLLGLLDECRADQVASALELSNPRRRVLHAAYTRMVDALGAIRLRCDKITLAIWAHRRQVREQKK
jgi:hypothetical protein